MCSRTSCGAVFPELRVFRLKTASIWSVEQLLSNERWRNLEADTIHFVRNDDTLQMRCALKSAIAQREMPLLNCRLLFDDSELPDRHTGLALSSSLH